MEDFTSITKDFYSAAKTGDLQKVKIITNYITSLDSWCKYRMYNMLSISIFYNYVDIARLFVNKICGVVDEDIRENYNSPLHTAVLHGDSSLVKLILKGGALHTSRNIDGLMPLHVIVYRNPTFSENLVPPEKFDEETSKILDVLLEFGAKIDDYVDSKTKFGYTCFHLAAECGNERIIPLLLENHFDIDRKTKTNITPLHVAVINGNYDIMNLLLENGGSLYYIHVTDKLCLDTFDFSIIQGRLDMLESLLNCYTLPSQQREDKFYNDSYENNVNHCLLTAARMNKPWIVEYLLKKGANVNTYYNDGRTALHFAAQRGAKDMVRILLDHGANVTVPDESEKTALYCAIKRKWMEIVKILINNTSDSNYFIDYWSFSTITPFQLAVGKGYEEIVKLMLQKLNLADINKDKRGTHMLYAAIVKNRAKMLKLLLEYGIDPNVRDWEGKTALQIAAEEGSLEMVQEFSRLYTKREKKWKEGNEALYAAILSGRLDVVKFLLKEGADLKARFEKCLTPLCAAAKRGYLDVLKFLLAKGLNVNEISFDGRSALICAVQKGYFQVAKCLLQSGAHVNLNVSGESSLHFAAKRGSIRMVKLLLSNGADVNEQNLNGETPLFLAVKKNFNQMVKHLIRNGADVNIADKDYDIFRYTSNCMYTPFRGVRPLMVAVDNYDFDIVQTLLESGAPANLPNERIPPLHFASAIGSLKIVKELVKFGANVNAVCEQNYTAIFHATANGELETFMYLLSEGAQLDGSPRKNQLIHIALTSIKENTKIVEVLLDHGISPRNTNYYKQTALHAAISLKNVHELRDMLRLLLSYGRDIIDVQDIYGNTPIHIAASKGNFVATEVLLEYGPDINIVNNEGKTALKLLVYMITVSFNYHGRSLLSKEKYTIVAILIVREIALRESAGRFVNDVNLLSVKSKHMNPSYEKCKKELSKMKCRKLYRNVTLYDVLTTTDHQLASYMGNKLRKNLIFICRTEEFKRYGTMIEQRMNMALKRREMIPICEKVFKSIFKFDFIILDTIYEIFSYLSSVDMHNMARVFQRAGQ